MMMKPTRQGVPMMVGTAVEIVSIQIFVLHVYVIKEVNKQLTLNVSMVV